MSPEDPFTSVKWDRHEDPMGDDTEFNPASLNAASTQNSGFSDPESHHLEAEHAPATETPSFSGNIDADYHTEVSESPQDAILEKTTEILSSEGVSSHILSTEASNCPENTLDGDKLGEQTSDMNLDEDKDKSDEDKDKLDEDKDKLDENIDKLDENTQDMITYADNLNPNITQDAFPHEGGTESNSIHSSHGSNVSETGAQASAFQGTLNTSEKDDNRQVEAFQKMADKFAQYDISSHISEPLSDRDGNSKAFISYLVVTRTNHPDVLRLQPKAEESGYSTVKVRRRYGDFRFLHDCLMADFPQLLVPPLPAKSNFKYLTGDTFSTSFVHKRLHSLDRFISYICQHKLLSQSSVFHYFISDSAEWATFTQNLKILKDEDSESSIVGKVVNEELLTETVMNFFTSSKHKRETNKDILEISEKLKKLYENLIKLDRIFSKLNKKNSDLKTDYEAFSQQIKKLAALNESSKNSEVEAETSGSRNASGTGIPSGTAGNISGNTSGTPGNSSGNSSGTAGNSSGTPGITSGTPANTHPDTSHGAFSANNTVSNVTTNFRLFSESLVFFSENWSKLYKHVDESFLVTLKDCSKYIIRLTNLIELQHNKKIDLQVLQDYLNKARTDLANLSGHAHSSHQTHHSAPNPALIGQYSGGIVNNTAQLIKDTISTSATPHIGSSQSENKKWKLQSRISQLESEITAQTRLVNDLTSRIINEEYPNWEEFNKAQLKKAMADLCDEKISFYKGMMENWSEVEMKLMKRLEELE